MDPTSDSGSARKTSTEQTESDKRSQQQRHPSLSSQTTESNPSESTYSRRASDQSMLQHDLSRDAHDMYGHHPSTPPGASSSSSIKYTRTGRVSKAAKGQRVHHCDECDKVFSRAEHLRRHQQNHRPGAFPCDFPGCGRSFHREDLLSLHRARHSSSSRRHSQSSTTGSVSGSLAPLSELPQSAPSTMPTTAAAPAAPSLAESGSGATTDVPARAPKRLPIPPNELPMAVPLEVSGPFAGVMYNPWMDSPPCSPSVYDYDSPDEFLGLPYIPPRASVTSDTAWSGNGHPYYASPSSVSDSSSIVHPYWSLPPAAYGGILLGQDGLGLPSDLSTGTTAVARDVIADQDDLLDIGLNADDLAHEQRYVDAYFAWVHDQFPIIFKPSFNVSPGGCSQLLLAAVMMLGAQALGRSADISNARELHEKCTRALKKLSALSAPAYSLSDMQAIFLVEIYSTFKSTHPPATYSKNFRDVYQLLSNDPEASLPIPKEALAMDLIDDYTQLSPRVIHTLRKQRLLLACYTLDQQHAALFGTSPAFNIPLNILDLPFPSPQAQWDSPSHIEHPLDTFNRLSDAFAAISRLTLPATDYHDAFRSQLMLSAISDPNSNLDAQDYPLLLAIEPSPRMTLAYHTTMLCESTPVRDLLAVIGGGAKSSTQAEYTASQIEVREWASQQPEESENSVEKQFSIHRAISHAFAILEIYSTDSRTGLLYQEWAVFLAAVVIWLRVRMIGKDRPAIPVPVEELINAGSAAAMGWKDARNLLQWVKVKLEVVEVPVTSGRIRQAVGVLGKLMERGAKEDWY